MALLAQLPSCSVLQHLRSAAAHSSRQALASETCFRIPLSHRTLPTVRLQPSIRSLNSFQNNPLNETSQVRPNPLCCANFYSQGNFQVETFRCSKGDGFQASFSRRLFCCSTTLHIEAVAHDRPKSGGHVDEPEPRDGPSQMENFAPGTTEGSSDPPRLSSLYVPRFLHERYASVLTPHMNFDKTFDDVQSLVDDLLKRGGYEAFTVDKLNHLKEGWERFSSLKSEVGEAEETHFEITKQRKIFIEKMKSTGSELKGKDKEVFDRLGVDMLKVRKQIKVLTPQLNDLEQTVVPDLLHLPNTIDKTTPLLDDKVLFCLHDPPEFGFPARSHVKLGHDTQTLELADVAPGAFYLLGDLAQAELALQDLLKDELGLHFKYLQHGNPDFGNGVTVEGCGYAIHDPSEVLLLMAHSAEGNSKEFLTGGSSLPSFAGYFAKKAVTKTKKFLPQKLFSIGRLYTPRKWVNGVETCASTSLTKDSRTASAELKGTPIGAIDVEQRRGEYGIDGGEDRGIFSSMQSTSVSAFVADTQEARSEEHIVNELLAVCTAVYAKLGLHFRIVQRNAKALKSFEKAGYSIEMMTTSSIHQRLATSSYNSPVTANHRSEPGEVRPSDSSVSTYTEVGRISVIGDYVSRRLLMLYDKRDVLGAAGGPPQQRTAGSTRHGFLNVVFAEILNVSKFLAVMMENTQTQTGGYKIPDVLLKYPVMTGA